VSGAIRLTDEIVGTLWTQPDWLADAHAWIAEQLRTLGVARDGPITQPHVRPWATAMRVPTERSPLWFKAITPALAHEAAITEALSRWAPGRTPRVLTADFARNWLLVEDGGVTLSSLGGGDSGARRATELASYYARLQRHVAQHAAEMLALRVPDCRLEAFPSHYCRLLEDTDALMIGRDDGLSREEYDALVALVPTVTAISAELAAFGLPATIQHDDLHGNNVLVRNERLTVFDWGDSSVAHPFLSLTVLLRSTARGLKVNEGSPEINAVRRAYLDAWDLRLTDAERDRACLLADALGRISRALNYHRLVPALAEPYRSEYMPAVAGWLQEFISAPAAAI
jgi:hypothetical protein